MTIQPKFSQVLIIGSGPAGCTAALYAARAGLEPTMLAGRQEGGQLMTTHEVENYPGFVEGITGPYLMHNMLQQAAHFGTTVVARDAVKVVLEKSPFVAHDDAGGVYLAGALIIASGAKAKYLGLPSEANYLGFGVSGCATCDGHFFKGQRVLVIGGGNSAVEEALYLSGLAKEVFLVHRRDQLRAEKILQDRLFAMPNISVIWNHQLVEVLGKEGEEKCVTAATLREKDTGRLAQLPVEGIFIAIGHLPNTGLFKPYLRCDEEGYIITEPDSTRTSVDGVFAAGDVQDKVFRQAVTAAGTGCMAAIEAGRFLRA